MSILTNQIPVGGTNEKPLSEQCRDTAVAIRHIRAKLQEMVRDGFWPFGRFKTLSIIIVSGWGVARALGRLATDQAGGRVIDAE